MKKLQAFTVPLDGVRLIEANAGTGKTYTITTLYLRLLLERRLEVGQILVVTYTNAATAELRRKVRERLADMLAALRGDREVDDATVRELAKQRRAAGGAAVDCQRLAAGLYGFDEAAIFTIHGFCQRVLQEHAFESGVAFDAELVGDDRLLIDEVVRDFWTSELYAAPGELVRALEKTTLASLSALVRLLTAHPTARVIPDRPTIDLGAALAAGNAVNAALQQRRTQLHIDLADFAVRELRRRKEAKATQSFDDLLQRLDAALRGSGGEDLAARIRARFTVALVDEFQDTDPTQSRIFERLYRHPGAALFLIGDPKQAIYGFRGADVFTYVGAKGRVRDEPYALDVNWRSSPSLVRAVNTIFSQARAQFLFSGIPFFPSRPAPDAADRLGGAAGGRAPLRVLFVGRSGLPGGKTGKQINKSELGWFPTAIAGEITRLLNADTRIGDRRVEPGDIAVLCRTNRQCAEVQTQLAARGVATVMYGDTSVFETAEADAVARVIRALADPGEGAAIAAALLTPIVGLTGDDLIALRADDRAWEEWIERFRSWNVSWKSSGFTVAFRRLLDECDVPKRLLSRSDGERRMTNVLHLGELLQTAAVEEHRGPLALVEWLQRMRQDEAARGEEAAESAQIRLESDTRALKLITIHKSKGLEYPVVVCPYLWDGGGQRTEDYVRCHADADDQLTIDLGSERRDHHLWLFQREALAESLRLLYVALTRATQLCIVAWGALKFCDRSALGYLLHQSEDMPLDTLAAATEERIKHLSDAEMRADLERLAAASHGAIEVIELSRDGAPRFALAGVGGAPLHVRTMSRGVLQPWRLSSFSALAASDRALPEPVEEGADRDELSDEPALAVEAAVRGFPRGRRLGNLVHKLFETTDFTACDQTALRDQAARLLPVFGVEPQWADAICAAITDVLDTPLPANGAALALRQIPAARRLNELEFVFPVALDPEAAAPPASSSMRDGTVVADASPTQRRPPRTAGGALTADRLADVLAARGAAWLAGYAERVRRLSFAHLSGYLKGFIDLVFAHGEQWFVVDYKTNDLGPHPSDYRPSRLLAEMQRHHYVLQYHLYSVALHRYLQRRLAGYDCARHFGGVLYLFVRGMAPGHAAGCGVFFDRPAPALIDALSATLAGAAAGDAGRMR